jgi:DNA repair protein RadC
MRDIQYHADSTRLAALIEQYTDIPQNKVYDFVMENAAGKILPYANKLCETDTQKEKLTALFEFKNLYETMKSVEKEQSYSMDSTSNAKAYFTNLFADIDDKERVVVAYLDAKNHVIKTKTASVGTVATASVFPREIIKEALFQNASGIIIAHNHPSGSLNPSPEDIRMTENVKAALDTMNITLLDHVIVADGNAITLADEGLMPTTSRVQNTQKAVNEVRDKPTQSKIPSIKEQFEAAAKEAAIANAALTARDKHTPNRAER